MKSRDWLNFKRKVRFGDCDSANVINFHNLLKWCHESWEESIEKYGIPLNDIFPNDLSKNKSVFPIVSCQANFLKPIKLGDILSIQVIPSKISNNSFQVQTIFSHDSIKVAEGKIIHCSIHPITRFKLSLPDNLEKWIEASNINNLVQEC